MILYYTVGQKTKVFAEALAQGTGLKCYRLESKLEKKSKFIFNILAGYLAVRAKEYPVDNMPKKIKVDEIYLCAPVWAGTIACPAWYFLNRADLKGRKVNILLTSASNDEKYRAKVKDLIKYIDCVPGEVYGFASAGSADKALIVEQLSEMLPGEKQAANA